MSRRDWHGSMAMTMKSATRPIRLAAHQFADDTF
jgi:hypothetical protein